MLEKLCLISLVISITGENLALDKPAMMSTTMGGYISGHAVDGDVGTELNGGGSCAHTDYGDLLPWWLVDLQGTYTINTVTLTNRGDDETERLRNFTIEIFKQNPARCEEAQGETCFYYNDSALGPGETRDFNCPTPTRGRFVRVLKRSEAVAVYLTLCEVQISGHRKTDCEFPSFPRIINKRLVSGDMETKMGMTPVECASVCARKIRCVAFNFNANTKVCELVLNPEFTDTIEINPDWSYYGSDLC